MTKELKLQDGTIITVLTAGDNHFVCGTPLTLMPRDGLLFCKTCNEYVNARDLPPTPVSELQ